MRRILAMALAGLLAACASAVAEPEAEAPALGMGEILEAAPAEDWRRPAPENMLYMDLPSGRVVFELAPGFAPNLIGNLRILLADGYFDGGAITRSQDNYVVQWAGPQGRDQGAAAAQVEAEFYRPTTPELAFTPLPDPDTYAPEVGFTDGFPVGRGSIAGQESTWLAHCYGMLGVGRDVAADSGNGAELYVVTGNAPRHLDRNVVLIGRVLQGIELLSSLPRGTGPLGFYETEEEYTPIVRMQLASDVPEEERTELEVLRTDSESFEALITARRFRRDEWFIDPAGHISLCNMPIPVRPVAD